MKNQHNAAFSLIEILIAMAISSLVAIGIYQVLRGQVQSTKDQTEASQQLRNSQRARFLMGNDIAQAGFDPLHPSTTPTPIAPVTVASNDSITLQSDFNMNGTVDDPVAEGQQHEKVIYSYDGSKYEVLRNGTPFLTNVQSFSLSYYIGSSTTPTTSVLSSQFKDVRKVKVIWTQSAGSKTERQEFEVAIKNYRG